MISIEARDWGEGNSGQEAGLGIWPCTTSKFVGTYRMSYGMIED